ncbi:MAG: hypothetical protein ACREEM_39470 [Blastocatellia bacterium]
MTEVTNEMKRESTATRPPKPGIPEKQWELPVTFSADGKRMLLLNEVAEAGEKCLPPSALNEEQESALVVRRIELQQTFEIAMIGAGLIDKERAINEVKARSKVGETLIQIERNVLNNLWDRIAHQ